MVKKCWVDDNCRISLYSYRAIIRRYRLKDMVSTAVYQLLLL